MNKKQQLTLKKGLFGLLVAFIILILVIPELKVSAEAVAAENFWFKFHKFFVDAASFISNNGFLLLILVVLGILGFLYLRKKR